MSLETLEKFRRQLEDELHNGRASGVMNSQWLYRLLSTGDARQHLETMRSAAATIAALTGDPTGLRDSLKCVSPVMWDGATGYIAIENTERGRVVRFDFESVPALSVVDKSFDEFLQRIRDAIRENAEPDWNASS